MEKLQNRHIRLLQRVDNSFSRYLLEEIPWEEQLIGIKGARGVGKTTMILQHIKQKHGFNENALYISLDDLYFAEHRLIDFVENFVNRGGEYLYIDEVHKYKNWSIEIKNIYDTYQELKVVFTGSSLLEILNSRGDLSRRALVYKLNGMSFREFLVLEHSIEIPKYTLEEILTSHKKIATEITSEYKPLKYFQQYLKVGYFPFYNGNEEIYYKRLIEIINMIVDIELPYLRNTDVSISNKIKQMLYVISQSVPFTPNVSSLANKINTTRKTLLEYMNYLDDAQVFNKIYKETHGIGALQKPDKLYLENTNYMYAINADVPNIGNVRETFFLNQLKSKHVVNYGIKADFRVDDNYIFEVGGKSKTQKQIADLENAYIVKDDILIGDKNVIPLWMFGLLY